MKRNCKHCGAEFTAKRSDKVFCKKDCATAHSHKKYPIRFIKRKAIVSRYYQKHKKELLTKSAILPDYGNKKNCYYCGNEFEVRKKYKYCSEKCHQKWLSSFSTISSKNCKSCGKLFTAHAKTGKMYCTPLCRDKSPHYKMVKRRNLYKRKHRIRGGEAINLAFVFERDSYTCQLCLQHTPIELRGKYEHNSPEIDHIIPLSKGGEHTYSNVHLLCRKCNYQKGDHIIHTENLFDKDFKLIGRMWSYAEWVSEKEINNIQKASLKHI